MARLMTAMAAAAALLSGVAQAEYTGGDVTGGGKITGKVTLAGAKPAGGDTKRNKDPGVCGTSGKDERLMVGDGGGVKDVIVYLKGITKGKAIKVGTATLDQKKCSYEPHVQAVAVGTTLTVVNSDSVLHNVHASQGSTTVFNYAMPTKNQKIPKKLAKAGIIKLKCDVHGWMNGAIGVIDNPYFAVTGADGSFTIDDVPAGTYTIAAWQEVASPEEMTQQVTVAGGAEAKADMAIAAVSIK